MIKVIQWINYCVTLHNMLAHLGNSWNNQHNGAGEDLEDPTPDVALITEAEINCKLIGLVPPEEL
ncbi:hypothetical protein MJO29_004032 [Puccinia striiformis f. sp. tritici]|nr:hypothetical protein MJO29_004032 [Puccinia striiformis f. sp. tritici]